MKRQVIIFGCRAHRSAVLAAGRRRSIQNLSKVLGVRGSPCRSLISSVAAVGCQAWPGEIGQNQDFKPRSLLLLVPSSGHLNSAETGSIQRFLLLRDDRIHGRRAAGGVPVVGRGGGRCRVRPLGTDRKTHLVSESIFRPSLHGLHIIRVSIALDRGYLFQYFYLPQVTASYYAHVSVVQTRYNFFSFFMCFL